MDYQLNANIADTVLGKIINDKISWIAKRKLSQPLESFEHGLEQSSRSFAGAFNKTSTNFILECKKASPSKGLIREHFDLAAITSVYKEYAAAISVLTDEEYFQGSYDFLPIVSKLVDQPVLCKDFIIDEYQIYLARHYQADAILLMLSVLSDEQYISLAAVAKKLNMGILTEVSNQEEALRANKLGAEIVGINNRNLRDLSVDLNTTNTLASHFSDNTILISESGIRSYPDVRRLAKVVDGFLIGSALMGEDNLELAVRKVLLGDNKVCGLTRPEDALAAYKAGAVYGGLIFVQNTPRHVTTSQAKIVSKAAPMNYVGVFRNENIDHIVSVVKELDLFAVQLHGHETQAYVNQLRKSLPANCQIWKALSIDRSLPERDWSHIDKYVFDHGPGGTGATFDWSVFNDHTGDTFNNVLLAGGLNPDNCDQAAQFNCGGLDFNSGVESAKAIKDADKINKVFTTLRSY